MAILRETLIQAAKDNLKNNDSAILTDDEYERMSDKALSDYSRRRPNYLIEAYTATTAKSYELPSLWYDGLSYIAEIEYPVEQSPKTTIGRGNYDVETQPDGDRLRFVGDYPGNGNVFWVRFTSEHIWDSGEASTAPASDQEGLSYLLTSLLCKALASFYGSKSHPSVPNIDLVAYPSRVDEYRRLAEVWHKKYIDVIKQAETGVIGTSSFLDSSWWDRTNA